MGRHKYPCGVINFSACTQYTGDKLKFMSDDFECDTNLDEVLKTIGDKIDDVAKAIDVSTHTASCITLTSPKTAASVLQDHATKLCALSALVEALQTQVADIDIATELVTIDLGCLKPAAAPCETTANTYSLISILTLFKNEICAIKTSLGL